jgi:hypothetical protein
MIADFRFWINGEVMPELAFVLAPFLAVGKLKYCVIVFETQEFTFYCTFRYNIFFYFHQGSLYAKKTKHTTKFNFYIPYIDAICHAEFVLNKYYCLYIPSSAPNLFF